MPRTEAQKEADRRYAKSQKGKARLKKYRSKLAKSNDKNCSICGGLYYAKGLCARHYRQSLRAQKNKLA